MVHRERPEEWSKEVGKISWKRIIDGGIQFVGCGPGVWDHDGPVPSSSSCDIEEIFKCIVQKAKTC